MLRSRLGGAVVALCAVTALLGVCTPEAMAARKGKAALTGTITYRQRIALSPQARVKVFLQETSARGPVMPLDEIEIRRPGQVPIPFTLHYDPAAVNPAGEYSLIVRIYEGDRTRFLNAERYRVLTGDGCVDRCEVVVDPMN